MQNSGPGNSSWVFFILLCLFLKQIGWGKWPSIGNNMIVCTKKATRDKEWICKGFITQSQCTKLFYFYNLPIKILNLYMCVFAYIHIVNWFCQKDNDNLLNRKRPFQQNRINWHPYAERKWTTNLYLSLSTKATSRWIKDLAVKANTIKLLEENRREKRKGLRQPFLSNQVTSMRENSKLHFIKIKIYIYILLHERCD